MSSDLTFASMEAGSETILLNSCGATLPGVIGPINIRLLVMRRPSLQIHLQRIPNLHLAGKD